MVTVWCLMGRGVPMRYAHLEPYVTSSTSSVLKEKWAKLGLETLFEISPKSATMKLHVSLPGITAKALIQGLQQLLAWLLFPKYGTLYTNDQNHNADVKSQLGVLNKDFCWTLRAFYDIDAIIQPDKPGFSTGIKMPHFLLFMLAFLLLLQMESRRSQHPHLYDQMGYPPQTQGKMHYIN